MSQNAPRMPRARRRPIPGMSAAVSAPPPPSPPVEAEPPDTEETSSPSTHPVASAASDPAPAAAVTERPSQRARPSSWSEKSAARSTGPEVVAGPKPARRRQPAIDYATTRLVNFRIPVDLHDRFRALVREVEDEHPRLRHPSLTELVIALLEEGPQTAGEVAELIRRKRAAEHAESRS